MKTKLSLIAVVLTCGWMAVGDNQRPVRQPTPREEAVRHPRARELEQRVAELEALVERLSQTSGELWVQNEQQQIQIDRFAPLGEVMEVYTWSDGLKTLNVFTGVRVRGELQTDHWLTVIGNLYLFGNFIDN